MIEFLCERFREWTERESIVADERSATYGDLLAAIAVSTRQLDEWHVTRGQSIALLGDFGCAAIAMLFSLVERGAIIVPLSTRDVASHPHQLETAAVARVIDVSSGVPVLRELDVAERQIPEFEELRRRAHPGLVLFSSGSSGKPKGVVNDFARLLEKFRKPGRALRAISFLLFDHIGGLNTLLSVLSAGGTLISVSERSPQAVCRAIERHAAEVLPASPTFLNLLLASQSSQQADLSSLKLITYGTEPMPETTLRRLHREFPNVRLKQTYGLSELGILATQSKGADSLWMKIGGDGYELRVRDGLLEIKAHAAMLGYIGAPSPFTEDGWFRTGDEVEVEGEYFRVLGRRSEMINVGGQKVHPAEVEGVLESLRGVTQVRVMAEPHAIMGQVVRAEVVLSTAESGREFKARMHEECADLLEAYKLPQKIVVHAADLHTPRFKKYRATQTSDVLESKAARAESQAGGAVDAASPCAINYSAAQ